MFKLPAFLNTTQHTTIAVYRDHVVVSCADGPGGLFSVFADGSYSRWLPHGPITS